MTRARGLAAAALLLVLGVSACGTDHSGTPADAVRAPAPSSTPADPSTSPTPTPTTSASSTAAPTAPRTTVVVHDAGSAPRQPLQLVISRGTVQHVTMTMRMGLAITVNGRKAPTGTVPPMQFGMDVWVPDVSPAGDVTTSFRYGAVKVLGRGEVADKIRTALAPLAQLQGTLRTTATGRLIASDFGVPTGLDPTLQQMLGSMKQQLGNMIVPLPDEPVGTGATWTVHTEWALNGMESSVDYDYRLVERRGDQVTLETHYVQSTREQQVQLPSMPTGVTARVHPSQITGSGRTVVDLRHPMPVESALQARGPIRMTLRQDGRSVDMVQQWSLDVSLSE